MIKRIGKIVASFFTIVGVISSVLGIYSFIFGKDYIPNKKLTIYEYDIVSFFNKEINKEELNILYKNEKVNNLYMIKYTIKNNGKDEIIPSDYIENISLSGNWGKIIECNVIDSNNNYIRKNITEKTAIKDNIIIFPNILLNSNDYYSITVITTDFPTNLSYNAVISGISNINYNTERSILEESEKSKSLYNFIVSILSIICLGITIFITYFASNHSYQKFKFMMEFNCSDKEADLFADFYYRKLKKLKKENKMKEQKELNNQFKEYISNICNKNY